MCRSFMILLLASICYTSCSNQREVEDLVMEVKSEVFSFKYHGDDYLFEYKRLDDSTIYSLNKEVETLVNQLKSNPQLAIFMHPNGIIEYFDSPEELKEQLDWDSVFEDIAPVTKSIKVKRTVAGTLRVYEKDKLKGNVIEYKLHSGVTEILVPVLEGKWENEISSADLRCEYVEVPVEELPSYPTHNVIRNRCVATFFEHTNFEGFSMWFAVDPNYPYSYYHYFKSTPLYPGSGRDWNDKASSIKFSFEQ